MSDAVRPEQTIGPPALGWSPTLLKIHFDSLLADRQRQHDQLRTHYDSMFTTNEHERRAIREHYDILLTEIDRRYQARFLAAEIAVQSAFLAQEKAIAAALSAQQAAVNKAEAANEKRFESVNEFRSQLGDQARTFMPRAEVEAVMKAMSEKIDGVVGRMDRRDAQGQGGQQVWGYVAAAVGVMVGVAGVVLALIR